jgi:hypothetical protein
LNVSCSFCERQGRPCALFATKGLKCL